MGVVFKAQDPTIGRMVAIKTIRLGELALPQERQQLRDRLFREAQSAGCLSHPGIVTIYDIAEEGSLAYITMEYVDGQTLEKILDLGAVADGRRLVSVATQTALALDYAHSKGIVHRDVKPGNIMVTPENQVKITDFGIARIASSKLTNTGTVMGTPSYMSPEQVRGAVVDGRSDLFSLAVMIYEMLTGQKPFYGDSITTIIFKIVSETPVRPKDINPSVGVKVDAVVMRALAKDPAERYQTCKAFAEVLEAAAAQTSNLTPTIRRLPSVFGAPEVSDPAAATQPHPHAPPRPEPAAPERKMAEAQPAEPPRPEAVRLPPLASKQAAPAAEEADATAVASPKALPPLEEKKAEQKKVEWPPEAMPAPELAPRKSRAGVLLAGAVAVALAAGAALYWQKRSAPPPPETKAETTPGAPQPPRTEPVPAKTAALPEETTVKPSPIPGAPRPETGAAPAAALERVINVATEEPGARAVVDANEATACTTPCSIAVPPGRHRLVLTQEGHFSESRDLQMGGQPVNVRVPMRPILGTVMLSTEPAGATVTVDGKAFYGQTPLELKLAPGRHLITVTKEGAGSAQQTVEVTQEPILVRIRIGEQ